MGVLFLHGWQLDGAAQSAFGCRYAYTDCFCSSFHLKYCFKYPPVASVVVVSFSQLVILTFVRVQEDEQRLIHNEDQTKALEALHRQLTQTRDQLQQFLVIKQHRALEYKKPKICWFLPSRRDKILRSVGIFCALL